MELVVPVHVLGRPEGVRHTLDAVDDGAGEVVRGIDLKTTAYQVDSNFTIVQVVLFETKK